ncbi:hypothetical protein CEXT_803781 [Caerostris extrusa]|uniref:Uncharacterized protein n=1 Tax=Caerostris extrusa TaxID=172846 RepID=A0AAV4XF28_CAEEX|nr:hypothetical protein CEXT_803781 [Caerostris extrusa]
MDDDPYAICPNKWPRGNGGRQICNYLTQIDMRELIFPRKRIGESVPLQQNIFPLSSMCYSAGNNMSYYLGHRISYAYRSLHSRRLLFQLILGAILKNPNAKPPVRIHNSLVNVISGDAFDGKNRLSATVHARGPGAPLAPFWRENEASLACPKSKRQLSLTRIWDTNRCAR